MEYAINTGLKGKFKWLNDRPLFASISGGKDSTALGLYFKKHQIRFTPVFIDTGWEHPDTHKYIETVLVPLFGEFIYLKNDKYFKPDNEWGMGMEQLIKYNKMFPSGFAKFCTRELKIVPVMNFYSEVRALLKKKPINAVGIRAEESNKRAKLTEVDDKDEATSWRPLINFKMQDVINIHNEYSVLPNPLYLKGASRVGCYPCIYARKHEIRHLSFADPERIKHIDNLEKKVNKLRGPDKKQSTFFKSKRADKETMFINDIVRWSRSHKGNTLDDQDEIENQGCLSWGLCEPLIKIGDQLKLL